MDGTLQGPDALIELVAFHLHRMGAAGARLVTCVADGAPWIWKRLDGVIAQAKLDPKRVVEVLDWCHAVHHLSVALAALPRTEGQRKGLYPRLRGLLKEGRKRGRDRRIEGVGGEPARGFTEVAREPLFDQAFGCGATAG